MNCENCIHKMSCVNAKPCCYRLKEWEPVPILTVPYWPPIYPIYPEPSRTNDPMPFPIITTCGAN